MLVGLAASGGGWQGVERVTGETGVEVEAVTIVKAGEENDWTSGMAMPALQDYFWVEKYGQMKLPEKAKLSLFLPFSIPVISFMPKERRYEGLLR